MISTLLICGSILAFAGLLYVVYEVLRFLAIESEGP